MKVATKRIRERITAQLRTIGCDATRPCTVKNCSNGREAFGLCAEHLAPLRNPIFFTSSPTLTDETRNGKRP